MSQDEIMNLLNQKKELTSKNISEYLNLSKTTVCKQLSFLRKKKLIQFNKIKNSNMKLITRL